MSTTKMLLHTHVQQTVAFINSVLTTTVKLLEIVNSMAITIN